MIGDVPRLTEVSAYAGQPQILVSCTQLGTNYTTTRARKIVDAWVEFFASGPSPITDLEFTSRTPKRLFASLSGQTQLRRLAVKWGDYDDLRALLPLTDLRHLRLRGASSVESIEPLGELTGLVSLEIECLRRVHDLSPLGRLSGVTTLELGGDWMSPRIAHIDSIGFLRQMPQLEELLLHTIVVDDHDYSPLLTLAALRTVRVMKSRGMVPSFEELKAALPWSG